MIRNTPTPVCRLRLTHILHYPNCCSDICICESTLAVLSFACSLSFPPPPNRGHQQLQQPRLLQRYVGNTVGCLGTVLGVMSKLFRFLVAAREFSLLLSVYSTALGTSSFQFNSCRGAFTGSIVAGSQSKTTHIHLMPSLVLQAAINQSLPPQRPSCSGQGTFTFVIKVKLK